MPNELMTVFAFIGILISSLVVIMGISALLSLCLGEDNDERAFLRWLIVSIAYALSITLWALN